MAQLARTVPLLFIVILVICSAILASRPHAYHKRDPTCSPFTICWSRVYKPCVIVNGNSTQENPDVCPVGTKCCPYGFSSWRSCCVEVGNANQP
uniref:WAP domain-containing protein n=1 Tax=Strigamia maritima TaxID=126957 RepID=T1IT93_STRMM